MVKAKAYADALEKLTTANRTRKTIQLSDDAMRTIDYIARSFETDGQVINRILETLLASAPDFDTFYGEPRDGKGPSGQ